MEDNAPGFLATVLSNNGTGSWTVTPKITEIDGTPALPIKVSAVNGLYPVPGDVVLILPIRNNLDDSSISRYYGSSDSNGRIVAIATPVVMYQLKGDYKIQGNLILQGDLTVTGDITTAGNLTVAKNVTITKDLTVLGKANITGNVAVTGSITASDVTLSGKSFLTHTHTNNAPAPGPTGPPL